MNDDKVTIRCHPCGCYELTPPMHRLTCPTRKALSSAPMPPEPTPCPDCGRMMELSPLGGAAPLICCGRCWTEKREK